jgi:hypothetical protein
LDKWEDRAFYEIDDKLETPKPEEPAASVKEESAPE